MSTKLKVLHSVDIYLKLTENWIYPQIVNVPNVDSRVACDSLANLESFPIARHRLVVSRPPKGLAFGIPRIVNFIARRLGRPSAIDELRIRTWRPSILHAHFGTQGWNALPLKRMLKIPLVTSFYGYDAWLLPSIQPAWRARFAELFRQGDVFLVEGPALQQRLIDIGCPSEKIRVRTLGVDLKSVKFQDRSFSDGLKVAMMGRFVEKKGFVDGLRACALAVSCGANINVTIVGDASPDDPVGQQIKEELRVLARSPELSGRVQFTGFLSLKDAQSVLNAHNVLLCPSKTTRDGDAEGGYPVVLVEAMASGLLCVGSRHCDIPEVILDNKTGYLCAEGNFMEMAKTLQNLTANPGKIPALARAGRRHIEEKFNLSLQLETLAAEYRSCAQV